MGDDRPKTAQDEVSPWVLMKEGFLPTAERVNADIQRRNQPAPSVVAAERARYNAAPNVGLGAGLSDAEIARRQAEISAYYQRLAAEREARMPKAPTPEDEGYTRYERKPKQRGNFGD